MQLHLGWDLGDAAKNWRKRGGTLENPLWGMFQEVNDDLQVREWCGWSLCAYS